MAELSPLSIAVVCEGPADRRTTGLIVDSVLCAQFDWLTPELLESSREYRGLRASEPQLYWRSVRDAADGLGVRAHGHFDGAPGEPDAFVARLVLLVLQRADSPPDAVLLIRDSDRDVARRAGMQQARDAAAWEFAVVIGLAHVKRECWVLSAYLPQTDREKHALKSISTELGFDPCANSERLTAARTGAKKNAKRILGILTDGDAKREDACFDSLDLMTIERRGSKNGLRDFIRETQDRLIPLFRRA